MSASTVPPSAEPVPGRQGDELSAAVDAAEQERTRRRALEAADGIETLLAAAVEAVGGSPREGQRLMTRAIASALVTGEHVLVQAGTGTGKSVGYLVPAVAHAVASSTPVVISTATLALQAQIVDRDLPRVAQALAPALGRPISWQLVKGRRNYVCRHKVDGAFPEDEDALFAVPDAAAGQVTTPGGASTALGREVVRVREWAETTRTGDRDELVPGVSERAWRQVSVAAHECLGGQRCPVASACFSELARERAREVDVVVSNHAFVAIDSFEGRHMLPEHDVLIVDEAHELADRVTSVISDELTVAMVEVASRRARRAGVAETERMDTAAADLERLLEDLPPGRLERGLGESGVLTMALLRDAARDLLSKLKPTADGGGASAPSVQLARAAVSEVGEVAERLAAEGAGTPDSHDVVWASAWTRSDGVVRRSLHVAPLSVAGLLRERLFAERTVVLTSATLTLGGSFDSAAGAVGLKGADAPRWTGLDVGSPFDYPRQGILYLARHLPPPGRDGMSEAMLEELVELVRAAGGRTLGLFSSRRAAQAATEHLRAALPDVPVLCQGEDATPTLVRRFAEQARTCLFGTLSLWQGVDVPGSACQLVVIDRIPFPRPDDPLASARQQAVARAGGNGFMSVAATAAGLLLAQGAGRLIRNGQDRGVVAVLDSRLANARYGGFLRACLPPFWPTSERSTVLEALRRIDATAAEVRPVAAPADRSVGEAGVVGITPVPGGAAVEALQRRGGHGVSGAPSAEGSRSAVTAGRGWTREEDAGLRAAVAAGRGVDVLAERYECTEEQLLARLEALGLDGEPDEGQGPTASRTARVNSP
ncbi:MAG: ATP-dependent DNA helicase [Kineosporiaceae bacterium]